MQALIYMTMYKICERTLTLPKCYRVIKICIQFFIITCKLTYNGSTLTKRYSFSLVHYIKMTYKITSRLYNIYTRKTQEI